MVTACTHAQFPHLANNERRDWFLKHLLATVDEFHWSLKAWAVMANHYHLLAASPEDPATLRRLVSKLHMTTSRQLNAWDGQARRKVWFQCWDSHITFARSSLARLNYVNNNPRHHGIVADARQYRWCSAAWFEANAPVAFVATVNAFKTDVLNVPDEF